MTNYQHTDILTLAARWRVLGLWAVAFARHIWVLDKTGRPSAPAKAELLEAWTCAALIELTCALRAHGGQPAPPEHMQARLFLTAVIAALMALMLLARALRMRFAGRVQTSALSSICDSRISSVGRSISPTEYIDPG